MRTQQRQWAGEIVAGDVFVSNHPHTAGGSHLPDITVITPVFDAADADAAAARATCGAAAPPPAFWVASRGRHHLIYT